jgi:hypothetical protein
MKNALITLLCFFVFSFAFSASFTTPDYIVYNGCKYALLRNDLMEHYFNVYPEKRPEPEIYFEHTNKNYIAHFTIIENKLYLTGIFVHRLRGRDSIFEVNVIKDVFDEDTLSIDWYSGHLVLNDAYLVTCSESKPESPFMYLTVQNGEIQHKEFLIHKELRRLEKTIFKMYKNTNDYKAICEHYSNLGNVNPEIKSRILYLSAQCNLPERKEFPLLIY